MRPKVDPADWFEPVEIERARIHSRRVQRYALGSEALAFVILLAFIVLRIPTHLIEALGISNWALQVLAVSAVVSVTLWLLPMPLDLKLRALRERAGRNARASGARSALEDLAFAGVGIPIVLLIVWAIARATVYWWAVLSVLPVIAFIVAMNGVRHPRHEPLPEEALRRVRRLMREAGVAEIEVVVGPNRLDPRQSEVTVHGLGRRGRLVVARSALERPLDEFEVLMAGPIALGKVRFPIVRSILSVLFCALLFLPCALTLQSGPVQRWAGMSTRTDPAGIPVFILIIVPSFFLILQLMHAETRRRRRKSDHAALEFTRNPDAFERVLRSDYERTLDALAPSLYQRLNSDLPPPAERLAMADSWRRAQRVAVLFTDLEQSTSLVERLGDERWFELLLDHNEMMRSNSERHGGRELASAGDGFMFVFDDVGEALIAAIEMQRALAAYNTEHDVTLSVRMGVHTGEVIRKEDRIVGREVHVAARISAIAGGGQILASGNVRAALEDSPRFRFGPTREVELKGLTGTFDVCEVDWADASPRERERSAAAAPSN